jgi:Fe2+ transport system protein FeoA
MSDEQEPMDASESTGRRRRRRRRRRRTGPAETPPVDTQSAPPSQDAEEPVRRRGGRRTAVDVVGPVVSIPASGKNPYRKRSSRAKRSAPGSASARKRRLSRTEIDDLTAYLDRMPDALVGNLYRGLGGQPSRVTSKDRMIQLAVRAIAQGSRLSNLLKQLHERDRKALAALLQAGGIAHHEELRRELTLSYGGHDREWQRVLNGLADRGVVVGSAVQDGHYFYIIPEILVDGLLAELTEEMRLPQFVSDEVRVLDARPFCPPLDFSITTLATYMDQRGPRLTQRHEVYRLDQEAMDAFFGQIWESDSELFSFHLDFLMMHGMVELRGEYLSLNRDVMEEWLQLEPEDQRDLLFRALDKRMAMGEWILWSIAEADGAWVAERPLVSLYRRWKRGEDWRSRYTRRQFANLRGSDRESYSFSPLVRCGLVEMGQWGQEKFYRLSERGKRLLSPPENDGFSQFYLTPAFEIMAPAGLAPVLLYRIGELAELTGCDRANTYKITESTIERALQRGWRRDDILQFLRDNSQIGLPDNVEQTLKGWIGHRGDVEFHDLCAMTVHRSQIRRLEGHKRIKPYLLHRFAPGLYAVDRSRMEEIAAVLKDSGFDPASEVRSYPGDPEQVEARQNLHRLVAEARDTSLAPATRGNEVVPPEAMKPIAGTRVAKQPGAQPDLPPEVTPEEARRLVEQGIARGIDVEMVYLAKTGERLPCRVQPQRLALKADAPVLVGLDRDGDQARTFLLHRIERLRLAEEE